MKRIINISLLLLFGSLLIACDRNQEETGDDAYPAAETGAEGAAQLPADDQLINIIWQWEAFQDTAEVNDISVTNPEQYTLILRPDGTANIQADCNQVQWTYTLDGSSLSFNTLGASTLAFCGEESLDQEYLSRLGATGTYVMNEGKLVLNLVADAGNMIFANGGPASESGGGVISDGPFCEVVDPTWISLNTFGLNYTWQANCVAATSYDQSQPPGPKGLPEHIEINFGVANAAERQPGDPVIYIIPANAYRAMWEANGNDAIIRSIAELQGLIAAEPDPFPISGVPVLPVEEVTGVNDLAVQGEYPQFDGWGGLRFVGRFGQDANPVTNQGLRYIFQGFAGENDEIFVSMFWPESTSHLPDDVIGVSAEDMGRFNTNTQAYMVERAAFLNSISPTAWTPPLTVLDALLASIEYNPPQTPGPVPTVEVPTPEPDVAFGRVTAPGGVNIRSGPGSIYPIIGTAAFGTEFQIIGRSADNQWWVIPVPGAPNNQGWVSATYVQSFNTDNVPVIPAPPPPLPTATPTALPTPAPSINFWADSTNIDQGECTTLRWDVNNIQAVWVYPKGEDYTKFPTTGQGSKQVCPATTTTYEMRVEKIDGTVEFREITIVVNENNPLLNTSWTLSAFNVTGVPIPGTTITAFFGSGGHMSGNGGCNTYNGSYLVSGSSITVTSLAPSRVTCGAEIDQQETLYLSLLQAATAYEITGNQLILRNVNGQEILRYNRSG